MDDSDDDDSFVIIGTPLTPYTEGEALKKPLPVQEQEVKDNKGRARFHGAFTGGFSAGYFNTVGSKEGFTPSLFVSSKNKDVSIPQNQKPEDFMDDEDFGEHGIAPRLVSATADFTTKDGKRKVKETLGEALLSDLIVPARTSIGFKLLRDLGWRDGQGIGSRRKRVSKRKKASDNSVKVYGCALPDDESGDSDADFVPDHVTFAPKDVNPVKFKPKDNVHGLGYSGIKPGAFSSQSHFSLFAERDPTQDRGRVAKGIGVSGQAFGVGDFEDEDDVDVYATDNMDKYDRILGGQTQNKNHGWTAPKHKGVSSAPVGYLGQVLEGFKLSKSTLKPNKTFPPPQIAKDFKPFHTREDKAGQGKEARPLVTKHKPRIDANIRKGMLGELKSVFDLIPKADKAKMEAAKDTGRKKSSSSEAKTTRSSDDSVGSLKPSTDEPSTNKGPLFKGSTKFKPFASDPEKQQRYDQYLELTKKGKKGDVDTIPLGSLTEWERSKEKEEFTRASLLFKPLASMMATRFTSAKYQDNEDEVEVPADGTMDKSDQKKAVEMKMFGRLTRERFEWHPDRMLCKRFNVANPYPSSTMVGVPKVKRDKYSVFNFLNQPDTQQEVAEEVVKEHRTESMPDKPDVEIKPLAILAQEDVTLQSIGSVVRRTESDQATGTHSTEDHSVGQEAEVVSERPSLDIFKAIFSDSSDDSSPEEEEVQTDQSESTISTKDNTKSVTTVLSSIFGQDPSIANVSPLPVSTTTDPSSQRRQQTHSIDFHCNNGQEEDICGPALPPGFNVNPTHLVGSIPVQSLADRLSPPIESCTMNTSRPVQSTRREDDICGPALPPGFTVPTGDGDSNDSAPLPHQVRPPGIIITSSSNTRGTERDGDDGGGGRDVWVAATGDNTSVEREKKKHRKHNMKKKKSKHKKHKQKSSDKKKKKHKKQKRKKEVIVISSTSGESGSESSESDRDQRIIDRLKNIPKNKRPTASDFM